MYMPHRGVRQLHAVLYLVQIFDDTIPHRVEFFQQVQDPVLLDVKLACNEYLLSPVLNIAVIRGPFQALRCSVCGLGAIISWVFPAQVSRLLDTGSESLLEDYIIIPLVIWMLNFPTLTKRS